jgi:GNAT superfamily N-acetyltransferase
MIDAKTYNISETLRNGIRLTVRAIRADDKAEFAMIVEEDYQGLGLGKLIFKHLITIARAKGINKFEAEVLPANEQMLSLLRKTGLPMTMVTRDESVYVSIDLKPVDR